MKLQQLRYLIEVEKQQLNITKAARVLCTSQSGISKQIRLLEDELNVDLFERHGRQLISVSPAGGKVLKLAKEILTKVDAIKLTAEELTQTKKSIAIATTHTQARYVLPVIVEQYLSKYPDINLNIQQGTPEQVATLLEDGSVDIAIATEVLATREGLVTLPCYQWSHSVIVKKDHPLLENKILSLEDIIQYPIVTYVQGFTARYRQDEVFSQNGLQPNIVLTAVDSDVIKTYVRLGLGIGIIANMAFNAEQDNDLYAFNAEHLFGINTSQIAIKKGGYIKPYIFPFIEMFAPHLTQTLIRQAIDCSHLTARQQLFSNVSIKMYR